MALLALCAAACAPPSFVRSRTEYVMGTLLEVRAQAADSLSAGAAVDTAFAVVRRLDRLLSNYDSTSEISAIGREAPAAVPVSPTTLDFIQRTLDLAELSGGALDLTVEPVVRLWGFYGQHPSVPDSLALAQARALVDYRNVIVDSAQGTVRVDAGMALDPGATGKGYALAEAARALASHELTSVYFDFGGQLLRRGPRPVHAAVRHPRLDSVAISVIRFATGSLATSGDWERYVDVDGERFSHLIDPRSGRPVRHRWEVSVWHPDPFIADALSTALFVLGPQAGAALLERFPDAAALFVEPDGDSLKTFATPSWKRMEVR